MEVIDSMTLPDLYDFFGFNCQCRLPGPELGLRTVPFTPRPVASAGDMRPRLEPGLCVPALGFQLGLSVPLALA